MSLPRLLTPKQYAALIGKSHAHVGDMLMRGRITDAQKVGGRWVISEHAEILDIGENEDPEIAALAKYFAVKPELDWSVELPPDPPLGLGNKSPKGDQRRIRVPGFLRIVESLNLGRREVYRRTKVHPSTQAKMVKNEKVHPSVILRLSKGLEIPPEEFLKA